MKKTLRMKFMLLLFALVAGITNVWADDTYVKVTSSSQVTVGSQIIIVCESDSKAMTATTSNYPGTAVTISLSTITLATSSNVCVLTIGGSSGNYTLTYDTDTKLCWKKNGFQTNNTATNNHLWSISDSGVLTSKSTNSDASTRKNVRYNTSNTDKFGCYASGTGNETCIYVKQTTPTYTINAQSNNEKYGTVSLNGSVITGSPKSGCRYASPAYSVSPANSATVSQDGNAFTVTPSANTTVTINFEAIPTHTATFSVNETTTSENFAEGASIEFPDDPANISGRKFVGWVTTPIAAPTDDEPSFVNTATETMGNSDVTYYAVFAIATPSGDPVSTLTQTLQYDSWTYSGTTTDKSSYRLFGNNSYIESVAFDLSKLSKVKVWGGTYGGSYSSLTIGDGTNIWKSGNVSTSGGIGTDEFTGETPLTGTNKLRITATAGNGTNTGLRISKVEIYTMETPISYSGYCTSVVVYTITHLSNNVNFGTVTLSGEVITGSPKPGYRYASPAYTVSPLNSAIVVQDGNEFTVTPSANTTVTINFERIPTYTLSSTVSPDNAGTVVLSASSGLLEGATVSAEAAANAGYKFTGWSISETGATLSSTTDNPTTVTIGTANATVTANFEEVTTYAITYSVNGVTNTVNVEENTAVDLSAPNSALIPLGYVFKGWRTSAISTSTDTEPTDYVTLATSTADITYYAVMAVDSESNVTTHLTSDEIATNFAATAMSYSDAEESYTDTDESMTWSARCITNSSRHWIQLKSDNDVYIKAVAPQNITEVKVKISNASNSGGGIDDITKHGAFSGSVNLDKVQNTNNGLCGTAAASAIVNNILTINADGTSNTIYIHVTAAARVWNVDVTYVSINTTNFCTSVSTIDLTEDVTIDGDLNISYELTVPAGKTLTVTGNLINTTAANLIIEDGGQLILPDDASVQATVKNSTAASTETKTYDIQWNAISSPVDNVVVTSFVKGDKHNVYRYDEKTVCWQEYRGTNGFNNLQNGRGYIYRSTESGIEFQGEVITGTVSCADYLSYACDNNRYIGFNLIGNPFTHDITWSNLTTKTNISSAGFFLLGADGNWFAQTNSGTIAPMQAFLVQATEGSPVINISNTAGKGDDRYGNDQIQFTVNNSEYSDVAYAIFREGHGLNKIEHRNDNIPMLYIINDDKDYAIAEMPDNTNVINLGFKARAIGQYTLSLNAEGRYSYMHLYDKLTGSDVDMLLDNSYTFVGSPSDRNDRFVLRLNYNAANIDTESDIFAYQNGADIIISGTGELQIFDIMGHQVSTQRINGVETINVSTQGVYILRLVGTEIKTQKIVVR